MQGGRFLYRNVPIYFLLLHEDKNKTLHFLLVHISENGIYVLFIFILFPRLCHVHILGVSPSLVLRYCEGYFFFVGYRTLNLKFQQARTKIEVVLNLPYWLSQFSWDSQQGRLRKTSILIRAFWNFQCKVQKYSKTCSLHNTLIPNLVKPLTYLLIIYALELTIDFLCTDNHNIQKDIFKVPHSKIYLPWDICSALVRIFDLTSDP